MRRNVTLLAAQLICAGLLPLSTIAAGDIGQPATQGQINAWNDVVSPAGSNLPPGSGSVSRGQQLYAANCATCHGTQGQGGPMDRLVGGAGTLNTAKLVKTVGSYWPYATTVFDYIRRAMPFTSPGSLTNDQVYAIDHRIHFVHERYRPAERGNEREIARCGKDAESAEFPAQRSSARRTVITRVATQKSYSSWVRTYLKS